MKNDILNDPAPKPRKWKGYTLEELNYRRALTAVAIEIEKDKVKRSLAETLPSAVSSPTSGASMLSKALGALSYVDYAVLAFKLMKKMRFLRKK